MQIFFLQNNEYLMETYNVARYKFAPRYMILW